MISLLFISLASFNGAINTGIPTGTSGAGAWKFGQAISTTGLTLNTTKYIYIEVDGTTYKLATVN